MGLSTKVLAASGVICLLLAAGATAVTKHCRSDRKCTGTAGRDTLRGSAGDDTIYGLKGNDTLKGRGGSDRLYGGRGDDYLLGHDGQRDVLFGDRGDDLLKGGKSGDWYEFDPGWGQDTIADTASYWNLVWLVDVSDDLTIRMHSSRGRPEVQVVGGSATINWAGDAIGHVYAGTGDDSIWGDSSRNLINVRYGGSDTIYAGQGDDRVNADDLAADGEPDVINCGEGDDTVWYDQGEDTIKNCEHRNPDQP